MKHNLPWLEENVDPDVGAAPLKNFRDVSSQLPVTTPMPTTPSAIPGHPGQQSATVPLPEGLEEEAVKSAVCESSSESSSSSSSEEELIGDEAKPPERKRAAQEDLPRDASKDLMLVCEIDVREKDLDKLISTPRKASQLDESEDG